ncbi:3552_t:CDS:2, partial [Racocetra persica]
VEKRRRTMESSGSSQLIFKLLDPVPQYVLGCLPAIVIIGASPKNRFMVKLAWLFRCLGCPFTGAAPKYNRPFVVNDSQIQNADVKSNIDQCTATASVLERLSSLAPLYFIVVGVLAGISKTMGTISCQGWPYIPLLLSWTIPAILRRAFSESIIIEKSQIIINEDQESRTHKRYTVAVTAFISIFYPWIAVFLAYFTPPIGYYCRRENNLTSSSRRYYHIWFAFCGVIVAILLLVLGLLAKNNQWWVDVFGNSCSVASIGCM